MLIMCSPVRKSVTIFILLTSLPISYTKLKTGIEMATSKKWPTRVLIYIHVLHIIAVITMVMYYLP